MPSRNLTIVNRLGLHARAAAKFVEQAKAFDATISLSVIGQDSGKGQDSGEIQPSDWVDGKSIMGVMLLAAGEGTQLSLQAEGDDANAALEAIDTLVANRFGETQ